MISLNAELRRRFRTRETDVDVGGRRMQLLHPDNAEDLIDEEEFRRDERLPYWADLWPSARVLAERVLGLPGGSSLLELGCGVGLVSICAGVAGLDVCASDYYQDALQFTRLNAWRNGAPGVMTRWLDWRDLPAAPEQFDFVVASDVLYERWQPGHLARAFARFLAPSGRGILADPGRTGVREFLAQATACKLLVDNKIAVPHAEGTIRQTICIYEIRRLG